MARQIAITGATGIIGQLLVRELLDRGDRVTVLSRSAQRARSVLGEVEAFEWTDPTAGPAPVEALAGRDAVVNLMGEPVAQRWSTEVKERIRNSREAGTRHLVDALREADPRPAVLVSGSATGWYGPHGDEPLDESAPPARGDFLADVTVDWENEARRAEELGVRVVTIRTGVVLSENGGALEKMLPPFKMGMGGPIAGGRQYVPWVHAEDVVGAILFCLDDRGRLRAGERDRARAGDQPRALEDARAGARTPGGGAGARARAQGALRRHVGDHHHRPPGDSPAAARPRLLGGGGRSSKGRLRRRRGSSEATARRA
ncbi:MAG: TIGR01777 family oxidoreductase [Thermoleophilaceae bacterium]